ncbi:DUF7112 family protein [Halomarina ordinaria]|uniref:Uncharacterized protein n=1 Tax=Halomarina ordinaria TaxID=3033939 RepID=A0ABD5UFJ8_9EURY|nr:hypothetical protein [Halomarina sp. PSRA2]
MVERISHDNSSVTTLRARVERAGRTERPKLVLPEGVATPDDPVRLVLGGRTYHALIEPDFDGVPEIRGAYDNARLARERDGENHLVEWYERGSLDFGRSVHLDVVDPGSLYGVRAPGERATYPSLDGPSDSLADIARDVEDGE